MTNKSHIEILREALIQADAAFDIAVNRHEDALAQCIIGGGNKDVIAFAMAEFVPIQNARNTVKEALAAIAAVPDSLEELKQTSMTHWAMEIRKLLHGDKAMSEQEWPMHKVKSIMHQAVASHIHFTKNPLMFEYWQKTFDEIIAAVPPETSNIAPENLQTGAIMPPETTEMPKDGSLFVIEMKYIPCVYFAEWSLYRKCFLYTAPPRKAQKFTEADIKWWAEIGKKQYVAG